jgi:threonine synthase
MAQSGEGPTLAEGVRVRTPVRARALVAEILPVQGAFVAINEEEIEQAYRDLGRRGVCVEPTSALAWAALKHFWGKIPGPIVLILSGAGLKYSPKIS